LLKQLIKKQRLDWFVGLPMTFLIQTSKGKLLMLT